tara:strand:+ start:374 stop:577 length:204 start_codon:yes stop_codon:yes gene_type:complete
MWNKIKQFWNWILVKVGYRKALIIKRSWPYEDHTIKGFDQQEKLVYLYDEIHLESSLSRKFRTNDGQ